MKKYVFYFTLQNEYTISEFMNWIDDELMSQKDECPFIDYEMLECRDDGNDKEE